MREDLIHVNSKNEVLDFKKLGILVNYNELRDYEWTYSSENNEITSFEKGIVKKTIPFKFYCDEERAIEIKNQFYDHFDVDVLDMTKGYFQIGEYKYYCYITKSKKSNYLISKRYLELSIEVTSDESTWIREKKYNLVMYDQARVKNQDKKYTYSYPFIYSNQKGTLLITNDAPSDSDFVLKILGPCTNPFVKIGDILYQVNTTLLNDEYLEIDTQKRTIFAYSKYGEKRNVYHYRSKERANFFKKIQNGASIIAWNGIFKAEITIYEKRGEPKWIE